MQRLLGEVLWPVLCKKSDLDDHNVPSGLDLLIYDNYSLVVRDSQAQFWHAHSERHCGKVEIFGSVITETWFLFPSLPEVTLCKLSVIITMKQIHNSCLSSKQL